MRARADAFAESARPAAWARQVDGATGSTLQIGSTLYPAIRKLDEAFNFLTAEELRQIRAMAEHGDKAQALDVAIAALHRRFDGLREQAMGPAEQGLHRLSTAWNDLIEAVAVSEPVMKAVANLAHNMEALSKWVAGPTDADKGLELSHQIVSENKRLLELQDQRRRLVATRETLGPAFAAFPAELKELDRQIAAQEAKVNALIDKARAEAQAAEARLNVPANTNRSGSPPAIGVPVAPPSATITTAANDAAGAAEQERQRKIVDAAVDPGIFAAAIDDLFADPSIAADALWRAGGADPALLVRVIARLGDRITDFSDARFVSATAVLEVRVAEMPTPASGDTVETGGRLLIVQGEPLADALRLVWTVECRPA